MDWGWPSPVGIQISSGQLSNILIKDQETFHAEKDAIYEAGLRSSPWQHIDETGAVNNSMEMIRGHKNLSLDFVLTNMMTPLKKGGTPSQLHANVIQWCKLP